MACLLAITTSSFIMMFFFFFIIIIAGISADSSESSKIYDAAVLRITLTEQILDDNTKKPTTNINPFTFEVTKNISVADIIFSINEAAADNNILAIDLRLSPSMALGTGNATEIRNALNRFKESGKPIFASGEVMSHGSYYISSVADKVFLQPTGDLQWVGLSAQVMFYKGLFDKVGIQPEIIRHGKYKSAVEPFMQYKMSDANREQTLALVSSVWGNMLGEISISRNIDSIKLQSYASTLAVKNASDALELGFVDGLLYGSEVDSYIKKHLNLEKVDNVSLTRYISQTGELKFTDITGTSSNNSKNKIALIYAEGEIVSSSPSPDLLSSTRFVKQIRAAQKDNDVKSVVIRVNSPGGSALAADVMWHSVKELQAVKPVIVSFGNVAASGGYYLAAPADVILAEPTTITGSIGVFGVMFNAEKGLKDNLGITTDIVNTNTYSDIMTPLRAMNSIERKHIQNQVNETYKNFVSVVASGRNLTYKQVDSIAGGRVWSGVDALKVGLIDDLGGLEDAIFVAADKVGIVSDFKVTVAKSYENEFQAMLKMMIGEVKIATLPKVTQAINREYEQVMRMVEGDKVKCIMAQPIIIK